MVPKVRLARTLAIARRQSRGVDGRRTVSSLLRTTPVQVPLIYNKSTRIHECSWCRRWDSISCRGSKCVALGGVLRAGHSYSAAASCPFKSHVNIIKALAYTSAHGAEGGTCSHSRYRSTTRRGVDGRRTVSSLLRTTPVQIPPSFPKKKGAITAPSWCRRWDLNPHVVANNGF